MKSFRNALIVAACTAGLATSYAAFAEDAMAPAATPGHDHGAMAGDHKMGDKDIIEVATGPGMSNVTTLVSLIKAADLVDTLKGPGPFTVFAPTNAAFEKLGKAKCDELMKPENKEELKKILLMHVHVGDAVKAADVKTMSLSTASGTAVNVKVDGGNVMVNNAKVIKTDVMAKNGIIHQVDSVIMPESKM